MNAYWRAKVGDKPLTYENYLLFFTLRFEKALYDLSRYSLPMMQQLLTLLSRLPLRILYPLADGLAFLANRVFRYRRQVVMDNLRKSFPDKSEAERKQIRNDFYHNLADVIVETLKAITISADELSKRVTFHNLDQIQAQYEQRQSIVLLAAHQCNWEWLLLAGCLQLPYPVDAVYLPLNDPKMDALMHRTRARFGGMPIDKNRILRELLQRREQVRATALVADQNPHKRAPCYFTEFLHQETAFFKGIEQLPKAVQYPVFFVAIRRRQRGYYDVNFIPIGYPPYEKSEALRILPVYAHETEKLIQAQPANWLWSHKRWKKNRVINRKDRDV